MSSRDRVRWSHHYFLYEGKVMQSYHGSITKTCKKNLWRHWNNAMMAMQNRRDRTRQAWDGSITKMRRRVNETKERRHLRNKQYG